jgi:hypothetical protein
MCVSSTHTFSVPAGMLPCDRDSQHTYIHTYIHFQSVPAFYPVIVIHYIHTHIHTYIHTFSVRAGLIPCDRDSVSSDVFTSVFSDINGAAFVGVVDYRILSDDT